MRNTSITVYGSTGLENAYLVDGANTTGVEIGNQGKVLNFEFIQEVELKAGGYEAEYTRRPGRHPQRRHQVRAATSSTATPSATSTTTASRRATSTLGRDSTRPDASIPVGFTKSDYGADVGGFILKDRLWFFGAYDHVDQHPTSAGHDRAAEVIGTMTDLDTTSNLYSGKLTWHDQCLEHADRHASSAIRPTTSAPSARSSVRPRPTTGR